MRLERLLNIKKRFTLFMDDDDLYMEDMQQYVTLEDIEDMIQELEKHLNG